MTAFDLQRLRAHLATALGQGGFEVEVLRHEVGAASNRNRLTGSDEGMTSFNTDQLAWLVLHRPDLPAGHLCLRALALSAAIDARWDLWRECVASGVVSESWTWVAWADGFAGGEDELNDRLAVIEDPRERCGAASLAARTAHDAIGPRLLAEFLRPDLGRVYHRLLASALTGKRAGAIADAALDQLAGALEVLYAADVDVVLAELVRLASGDPERHASLLDRAGGELTAVARANRLLRRGEAAKALRLTKDMRLLSPAYPQAMLVAALAALESGDLAAARRLAEKIEDAPMRLKVRCRVAQATSDVDAELSTLVELHEIAPDDPDAFVQLVGVVERLDQHELSRRLCLEAQERFFDQPDVLAFIRRRLA